MDFLEQPLQDGDGRRFPLIAASPVQHQTLVGFDQEDSGATGWVEDDLVPLLQPVEPLPAQDFLQHQPHKEGRGINRGGGVFDEELIDVADEFNRQVFERVELP